MHAQQIGVGLGLGVGDGVGDGVGMPEQYLSSIGHFFLNPLKVEHGGLQLEQSITHCTPYDAGAVCPAVTVPPNSQPQHFGVGLGDGVGQVGVGVSVGQS